MNARATAWAARSQPDRSPLPLDTSRHQPGKGDSWNPRAACELTTTTAGDVGTHIEVAPAEGLLKSAMFRYADCRTPSNRCISAFIDTR